MFYVCFFAFCAHRIKETVSQLKYHWTLWYVCQIEFNYSLMWVVDLQGASLLAGQIETENL